MSEINEIEVSEKVSGLKDFFTAYDDGEEGSDCEDDGFLHINVGKIRFTFDVDSEQKHSQAYTEKRLPAYRKRLLKALESE